MILFFAEFDRLNRFIFSNPFEKNHLSGSDFASYKVLCIIFLKPIVKIRNVFTVIEDGKSLTNIECFINNF